MKRLYLNLKALMLQMEECLKKIKNSTKMITFCVFITLLIDTTLLTVIVPILPDYLSKLKHFNKTSNENIYDSFQENNSSFTCLPLNDSLTKLEKNSNKTLMREANIYHLYMMKINQHAVILVTIKPLMQICINPPVGILTSKIGNSIPLFLGIIIQIFSALFFALADSYIILCIARLIQGIGSSFSLVTSLNLIVSTYRDDEERGFAMSLACSGFIFGLIIGPPFGGMMYDSYGKASIFYTISICLVLNGGLILLIFKLEVERIKIKSSSLVSLLKDPYIQLALWTIFVVYLSYGVIDAVVPVWMLETMAASSIKIGIIFLPANILLLGSTLIVGKYAYRIGRWLLLIAGLLLAAGSLFYMPFATRFEHLFAPLAVCGFATGIMEASILPIVAYLVDIRHTSVYGPAFAMVDVAYNFSFILGPIISGNLIRFIGIRWVFWFVAIINLIFCPLMFLLRNPPHKATVNNDNENNPIHTVIQNPSSYMALER